MSKPRLPPFVRFTCQDCGMGVTSFGPAGKLDARRCGVCAFLHCLTDRTTREEMRIAVYDAEGMDHWRRVGCYLDEDFPERPCDQCGTPYAGPSVYCSLACADADAGG